LDEIVSADEAILVGESKLLKRATSGAEKHQTGKLQNNINS